MDWSQPQDNPIALSSGDVIGKLLPLWDDIPKSYKENWRGGSPAEKWFHYSNKNWVFTPRDGIDLGKALRQLTCVLRSLDPEFEYKIAGAWWLIDLFFVEINMDGKIYKPKEQAK